MDNPVVLTAARACARHGLATLRFNFRGVGRSGGAWDEGRGEVDDVRATVGYLRSRLDAPARVALAGYSFGASMAAAVAAGDESLAGLALIAPPLASPGRRGPGTLRVSGPLSMVAGSDDAYCPRQALTSLADANPGAMVTLIDGADHFFFTALGALDTAIADWAAKLTG
jgi:alpha/beta superfamily hydrolase